MHPLVELLITDARTDRLSGDRLADFWVAVSAAGTPLLTPLPDGSFIATFVYETATDWEARLGTEISQVLIEWDCAPGPHYATGPLRLGRLAGTDVWYGDVCLPKGFCGVYYVELGVALPAPEGLPVSRSGIIQEDCHEPWPASYPDPFNPEATTELDSTYSRYVVRTPRTSAKPAATPGTIRELSVDAHHLSLRSHVRHRRGERVVVPPDPEYPVWVYEPAMGHQSATLPVVVLLSGQIREVTDLQVELDRAIGDGRMAPTIVVAPGATMHGCNSWGYRRGYGPSGKIGFLRESLWPLIGATFPVHGPIHLVALGDDAPAALRTAAGCPELVGRVILLNPSFDADDDTIPQQLQGCEVTLGMPTQERQGDFAWSPRPELLALKARLTDAGADVRVIAQSDPNHIAAIDGMFEAIALSN